GRRREAERRRQLLCARELPEHGGGAEIATALGGGDLGAPIPGQIPDRRRRVVARRMGRRERTRRTEPAPVLLDVDAEGPVGGQGRDVVAPVTGQVTERLARELVPVHGRRERPERAV